MIRAAEQPITDHSFMKMVRDIQDKVLRDHVLVFTRARKDRAGRVQLRLLVGQLLLKDYQLGNKQERDRTSDLITSEIVGFGPIDPPIHDPDVTEIMINGPSQVFIEKGGSLIAYDARFRDEAHLLDVIRRIVAPLGRRVDQSSPMVDARLHDGSRINAIIPPVAVDGTVVTIRKFAPSIHDMDSLIQLDALSSAAAAFLRACVVSRLNLVLSGSTGSGKTTLLNVLSEYVVGQRVITLEDAAELSLKSPHVVRLECRPGNFEGRGEVTMRQLVRNALRMRPDRIIVGECRGAEAFDMLQAMNTGHEGSMTTIHANGPEDALRRLESMVVMAGENLPLRAVRDQVVSAADCIVHLIRHHDGRRFVQRVSLVDKSGLAAGSELPPLQVVDVFGWDGEQGLRSVGSIPAPLYRRFQAYGVSLDVDNEQLSA